MAMSDHRQHTSSVDSDQSSDESPHSAQMEHQAPAQLEKKETAVAVHKPPSRTRLVCDAEDLRAIVVEYLWNVVRCC